MPAIDKKMFVAEVENLKSIIDAVRAQQGSAAERHKNAIHAALGQDVTFSFDDMPEPPDFVQQGDEGQVSVGLAALAEFVQQMDEWSAQVANEAVTRILKASTDDNNLEALRTQYLEKKEFVEALALVLHTQKIDVSDVEIPQLRGARSASGTARKSAKTSHGQWYRIVDGTRKNQGDAQNTISAFAYWHGAALMGVVGQYPNNKGKGVPTEVLEKFLRDNVTDSPLGKSWSYERDGVTYGMDVKPSEKANDEEE